MQLKQFLWKKPATILMIVKETVFLFRLFILFSNWFHKPENQIMLNVDLMLIVWNKSISKNLQQSGVVNFPSFYNYFMSHVQCGQVVRRQTRLICNVNAGVFLGTDYLLSKVTVPFSKPYSTCSLLYGDLKLNLQLVAMTALINMDINVWSYFPWDFSKSFYTLF